MIDPRKDPTRRCLRVTVWPAMDRAAWKTAFKTGDILDDTGPASHWAEGTRRKVESAYGRWLNFLQQRGWLDPNASPVARVQPERIGVYLDELRATVAPVTVHGRILDLREALRVMAPDGDFAWLSAIERRLASQATPSREKRSKVRDARELWSLGLRLMDQAAAQLSLRPSRRAVHYRDGLMIAFLAARPLRRRTFTNLAVDRQLIVQEDQILIRLEAGDLKNGRPFEVPLPESLLPYMQRYLKEFRPLLLGRSTTDRLWVTAQGPEMADISIYIRIRKITQRELGVGLNINLFRDSLATSLAIHDPDHVRAAATLLGHRTLDTTNKYYNQAKALEAVRAYQDLIRGLRWQLEPANSRKRII